MKDFTLNFAKQDLKSICVFYSVLEVFCITFNTTLAFSTFATEQRLQKEFPPVAAISLFFLPSHSSIFSISLSHISYLKMLLYSSGRLSDCVDLWSHQVGFYNTDHHSIHVKMCSINCWRQQQICEFVCLSTI